MKVKRYKLLKGNLAQKRKQFEKQLDQFEQDANDGKLLCITDLIGNAEHLHLSKVSVKGGE